MSRFLTPLRLELLTDPSGCIPLRTRDGRPLFKMLTLFAYVSDAIAAYRKQAGIVEAVPGLVECEAGFITDLASFPQVTLAIFGDTAEGPGAAHDKLYSTGSVPRSVADAMLFEACIVSGIPKWQAALIYAGVRLGGAKRYASASAAAA